MPPSIRPGAALASTSSGPGALTPEIHFELDRWGNQVAIADARSAEWVSRYAYNGNNQLIQETRPDATTGQTFYDALGRVNTQTLDAAGHVLTEQHADGGVVSHRYDAFGDQRRTVDAEGHGVEHSYDAMGRMVMRRVTDVQVVSPGCPSTRPAAPRSGSSTSTTACWPRVTSTTSPATALP